jgi:NADH:ubiquinone oxidoreductase subunit 6 (subunit J)
MTSLFTIFAFLALVAGFCVIKAKNPVYSVLFLILVFCNVSGILVLLGLDFFAMVFLVVYVGAIAVLFLFVVMMLNVKLAEINDNILRYLPVGGLFGLLFLGQILLVMDESLVLVLTRSSVSEWSLLEGGEAIGVFILMSSLHLVWSLMTQPLEMASAVHQWWEHASTLVDKMTMASTQSQVFSDMVYVVWPLFSEEISPVAALGQVVYTYYVVFFLVASLILLVAMIGAIVLTMHKGVFVKRQEVWAQNLVDFYKTVSKIKAQ